MSSTSIALPSAIRRAGPSAEKAYIQKARSSANSAAKLREQKSPAAIAMDAGAVSLGAALAGALDGMVDISVAGVGGSVIAGTALVLIGAQKGDRRIALAGAGMAASFSYKLGSDLGTSLSGAVSDAIDSATSTPTA